MVMYSSEETFILLKVSRLVLGPTNPPSSGKGFKQPGHEPEHSYLSSAHVTASV